MKAYNAQRIGAGTVALGIAQRAFEDGLERQKTRQQFGRPIAEFQGFTIAGGTAQTLRTHVAGKLLVMKLTQTRDRFVNLAA